MKKILLLASVCTASLPLFAQQKQLPLNEVVITANKFDQKAAQTGKVVTVVSQKDLEHLSGKTLGQILNQQAGLSINGNTGSPGTNQTIYLRGADPKYTLIMIDGIPVSDISNINSIFDINLIPVSDVERIEIMKGGYASLYGSGATAGVINIITKKGGTSPIGVSLGLEAGSYNTFKERLSIHGRLKKTDYSVRFQNKDSKGFSSAMDTLGNQDFDNDGYHRKSLFANFGFHPNARWTLRPFIRYTYQKGGMDYGAYVDDQQYYYTSDYFQTGISIRHTFGKGDLNIKYSFIPITRHYHNDSTDSPQYLRSRYKSEVHVADLYLHYNLSDRLSFLAGNALRLERTGQEINSINGASVYKANVPADSAHTNAMSIYGSVLYHAPDGLQIELGGRLHQHQSYGFHPVFSINPSWLINKRVKIFVNIASSFTSPSLYQLYSAIGNPRLDPETGKSYEAGVESWFAHKKIDLSVTAFHRKSKGIIALAGTHYINYDRQEESGGEAMFTYNISDKIKLSAYYAYVTGEVTEQNAMTGKDSSYNNLFKRPENSAGMTLGYQLIPDLYLSLHGQYTGSRKDLFYSQVQEIKDLDQYFLLNFYAQYEFKDRYRVYISLNNITDSEYMETTGYTAMGFNFNAGIAVDLF